MTLRLGHPPNGKCLAIASLPLLGSESSSPATHVDLSGTKGTSCGTVHQTGRMSSRGKSTPPGKVVRPGCQVLPRARACKAHRQATVLFPQHLYAIAFSLLHPSRTKTRFEIVADGNFCLHCAARASPGETRREGVCRAILVSGLKPNRQKPGRDPRARCAKQTSRTALGVPSFHLGLGQVVHYHWLGAPPPPIPLLPKPTVEIGRHVASKP